MNLFSRRRFRRIFCVGTGTAMVLMVSIYPVLVHRAEQRALSLHISDAVFHENGAISVRSKVTFRRENAGILAPFCPGSVRIPYWGMPGASGLTAGALRVEGIPARFAEKDRLIISPHYAAEEYPILEEGQELDGEIEIGTFFNQEFRSTIRNSALEFPITVSSPVVYYSSWNIDAWFTWLPDMLKQRLTQDNGERQTVLKSNVATLRSIDGSGPKHSNNPDSAAQGTSVRR